MELGRMSKSYHNATYMCAQVDYKQLKINAATFFFF